MRSIYEFDKHNDAMIHKNYIYHHNFTCNNIFYFCGTANNKTLYSYVFSKNGNHNIYVCLNIKKYLYIY